MMDVRDSNGNVLADGDSVQIIKDLKVKGTSVTLKRGSVAKNIRLTDDPEEVECNDEKVKGLVLKTCFLKKVYASIKKTVGCLCKSGNSVFFHSVIVFVAINSLPKLMFRAKHNLVFGLQCPRMSSNICWLR